MIRDLNVSATMLRRILTKRPVVDFDTVEDVLMVKLDPPVSSGSSDDGSPRSQPPYAVYYKSGTLGIPYPVLAGSRISLSRKVGDQPVWESQVYEAVKDARPVRRPGGLSGWELFVLPFNELYPVEGTIKTQDGTTLGATRLALWTTDETEESQGTYENFQGEAPIDAQEWLTEQNASIWVDGLRYRIRTSYIDFEGPRVRFEARRANG